MPTAAEVDRILTENNPAIKAGKISDLDLRKSRMALKEKAFREAKKGNIFPLLRYEFRDLIIRDKKELAAFKKHCRRTDNLDLRLDDFQVDIIRSAFDKRHSQVFVSGGTKLGKGFTVGGLVVNLWFTLYSDSKIVLIGPDVEHVKRNLFAETLTWRRRMSSFVDGSEKVDCLTEKLGDPASEQHFVIIANPKTGEGLSGIHSRNPLFCFDESSGQADSRYTDSLSQCASGLLVAIGNPRQPSGWFWKAFRNFESGCDTASSEAGPRRLVSVGLVDCINVRANRVTGIVSPPGGMVINGKKIPDGHVIPEEMRDETQLLIPGQGCLFVAETLKRTVTPEEVEWRVFGRFPKDMSVFALFQTSYRKAATERWQKVKDRIQPLALGIDVAASEDGDYCALAWGDHLGCLKIDLIRNPNLMMLKGEIYLLAQGMGVDIRGGYVPVAIDVLQMGQMFADAMEMEGVNVIRVGGSSAAERNREQYFNRRAEVYGELASSVNPQLSRNEPWAIPDDDRLWEELYAMEKIWGPDGKKWKLNSKRKLDRTAKSRNQDGRDSIEEKIHRSPDSSDSLAYLYEAVRELPEFFEETSEQFSPAKYIRDFKDLGYGEVLVTLWDGKITKMPKTDFHEKYGEEPKTLKF